MLACSRDGRSRSPASGSRSRCLRVVIGGTFVGSGNIAVLRSETELGNLIRPLDRLQVFGIWPSADFRLAPADLGPTYVLLAVLAVAAACGLWFAWRGRAWPLLLYVSTLLDRLRRPRRDGLALDRRQGDGHGLDRAPAGRACGCAVFFERGRRTEAVVAAAAIAGGVLWSNALAYHDVWLAPRPALAELESIGDRFAGAGPTLMTEYQPYGVRHFLRRMEPESAGELRRRLVPLLDGQGVPKGGYADLDEFQTSGILVYRTLVLRRSPSESRPPSTYQLAWRGRYYEVWQRPDGDARHPSTPPARRCRSTGRDTSVPRRPPTRQRSQDLRVDWRPLRGARRRGESRDGSVATRLECGLRGSVVPNGAEARSRPTCTHPSAAATPSGWWLVPRSDAIARRRQAVADMRHWIDNAGQYTPFGSAVLARGTHHVSLEYEGPDIHPGSGGAQFGFGPFVLSRDDDDAPVAVVRSADARTLCGRNLDWIEALVAA